VTFLQVQKRGVKKSCVERTIEEPGGRARYCEEPETNRTGKAPGSRFSWGKEKNHMTPDVHPRNRQHQTKEEKGGRSQEKRGGGAAEPPIGQGAIQRAGKAHRASLKG